MKLEENQRFQIVARGLVFHQDYLLITEWLGGHSFPIGGRVKHGEPIVEGVVREVYEETGIRAQIKKLLYFAELFWKEKDIAWHEYGWYFWVELEKAFAPLDAVIPNPDSKDLIIRWVRVEDLPKLYFFPRFLSQYLPQDYASGFRENPRHILSVEDKDGIQVREFHWLRGSL